jgi:hypothetical protein
MVFALVLVAVPATALASAAMEEFGSTHPVSFGLGAGVSVPVSDAGDAFKNGWVGHGFVRLNESAIPVRLRMDFTFSSFDFKDVKFGTPGTQSMFAGLGDVEIYLLNSGPVRPYVIAGLGAYFINTELNGTLGGSTSDTSMGINGGVGIRFKLPGTLLGYVEGRVDNVYSDQGLVNADQIQVVPVTLGVVF